MTMSLARYFPEELKRLLKPIYRRAQWQAGGRIFCISAQKTGTTSVGAFFLRFGYPVATWGDSERNDWSEKWYVGDYESIFKSSDFKSHQVFEDTPWWAPDFYKVLYHRFPDSRFILFTRDSEKWFRSMMRHAGGKTLGNTRHHCKLYHREKEFLEKVDNEVGFNPLVSVIDNLMTMSGMEEHYRASYELRHREILEFFKEHDTERLFVGRLEDDEKWKKLGRFIGVDVPEDFQIHQNQQAAPEAQS